LLPVRHLHDTGDAVACLAKLKAAGRALPRLAYLSWQ
jgi:hypothetical protein